MPAALDNSPVKAEHSTAYARVADAVRRAIADGRYRPGTRLPTQLELSRSFGVSRITVVRALQVLDTEGWIERRQGVGTFVARRDTRLVLTSASQLYKQTFPSDGEPHHVLLAADLVEDAHTATNGVISQAGRCWHVVRLRRIGGRSVSYEETYLPEAVVPATTSPRRLANVLVHDFLTEECGVVLESTRVHIAATTLDPQRAEALDRPALEAGLLITRVNIAIGGRPISYSLNVLPADASEYFFEFRHLIQEGGAGNLLAPRAKAAPANPDNASNWWRQS